MGTTVGLKALDGSNEDASWSLVARQYVTGSRIRRPGFGGNFFSNATPLITSTLLTWRFAVRGHFRALALGACLGAGCQGAITGSGGRGSGTGSSGGSGPNGISTGPRATPNGKAPAAPP